MLAACYGYALPANAGISRLNATAAELPCLAVTVGARRSDQAVFEERFARLLWEFGGSVEIDRDARSITLAGAPDDEYLPHPMLVGGMAVMAQWDGRVAVHAASVAIGGQALLIFGEKFAGKSTLVGALALAGHTVIADDVSIAGDGCLTPGPRLVDLRPPADTLLGVARRAVTVRAGANRRLAVGPAPQRVPLGAIVSLAWGEHWSFEPLDVHERFELIANSLVFDPGVIETPPLVDLIALPAWRFVRPRSGARDLAEGARLLALLAAGRPPGELHQRPGAGAGAVGEPG
jgi:hypothetical protein